MSSEKNTDSATIELNAEEGKEETDIEDAKIVTKLLKNCAMSTVVLYSDRAEITHTVEHEFTEPGLYDICIEGMPQSMQQETLRVTGGAGNAILLEVSTKTRFDADPDSKVLPEDVKAKKDEVDRIEAQISDLQVQAAALDTSMKWLNAWSQDVANTPPSQAKGANEGGVPFLSQDYIANVRNFTQFYAEEQERLATQDANLREEMSKKNAELARAKEAWNRATSQLNYRQSVLIAVVSLQVTEAGKAAFHLVYRCTGCSWNSKYDCRVDENKKVQVTYFGSVVNATGITWENTRLTLSTAEPSAGGEPPELDTAKVSFVPEVRAKAKRKFAANSMAMDMECCAMPEECMIEEELCCDTFAPAMNVIVAEAKHGMTSCTFDIPRASTIESDGEAHKVTIAIIDDIEAKFEYLLLPRLHDAVYVKAVCTNPRDFCFLSGPANIFVDGSFVATCPMEYTAPGQEFSFFLGPDKDFRVTYKVPTAVADKAGIFVKSNVDNFVGEIRVKNNKDCEVKMTIQDQLPKSTSSLVTVTLLEPDIQQTPNVTIEERNLITWNKSISAGQTETYPIRFTVEYPKDKSISYSW